MAFIIQTDWVSNQAYTTGSKVNLNGVGYVALNSVTSTTDPSQDGVNWRVTSVTNIQDLNSLVEAIRLQLNVKSVPEINNSIPMFIQLIEESLKTRIRSPQQRRIVVLALDSDGKFSVPGDLIEIINLRLTKDDGFGRGAIEIPKASAEEFNTFKVDSYQAYAASAPRWWHDNQSIYIAPVFDVGTQVTLAYYASTPKLGSTLHVTNSDGEAINSSSQTSAQWVTAGNTAESFIQKTTIVTTNWFVQAAPQLLLYGALLRAKSYAKNNSVVKLWEEMYVQAELEVRELINRFEEHTPHVIEIETPFFK